MSSLRQGKGHEKSNFARTCNLLSQYVKEKGNLRDLNLDIGGKVESFQTLLKPAGSTHAATKSTTMNLLTNMEKSPLPLTEQSEEAAMKEAAKPAPLTIFYNGRVLVFDDYPAEKANELLSFAKNVSLPMPLGDSSNALQEKANVPSISTPAMSSPKSVEQVPRQPETASDLPIARRSSLHRFLAKRKDRATARGPYQVPGHEQPGSSSKADEQQLELRL